MSDTEVANKPVQGNGSIANGLTNGITNGSPDHKSSKREHKESRDRDHRDHHKSSHKDKDRNKDRSNREKGHHSSSHKSSHRDRDKDRERHRDRERSDKGKDRHKDKERDRHKDKERSDKDKPREKDRERSDKEKSRDKDRHKDKHKDKDRSREKDKSRSDKEKDRNRTKDKSRDEKEKRSSGGSSRDKSRHHSSGHKSSHRDKRREHDKDISPRKEQKVKVEPNHSISSADDFSFRTSEYVKKEVIKEEYIDSDDKKIVLKEEYIESPDQSMECGENIFKIEPKDESVDSEEDHLIIKEEPTFVEDQDDDDDDDDIPLSARKKIKVDKYKEEEDDDDDKPLIARKKVKTEKKRRKMDDDEDDAFKPEKKKIKKEKKKIKREKNSSGVTTTPSPKKKKKDEEENVWKWWEEEKRDDGIKWTFLEHKGPVFPPPYERIPRHVKFYYNKEHFVLSDSAEEVAGFYARMLEHDYTTKEVFNKNFFKDWRKMMNSKEREKIADLRKCNFTEMFSYFVEKNEERKNRSKEEKKTLKEENQRIVSEYGWCNIDGHKQRIGNFKIEPPGLFRGRGEHPKQGMLKKRIEPEEIMINCSKNSVIPKAPPGHKWKSVRFDSGVTWLACWVENVQGQFKYVMLNAASKLKGEKDWQKYEIARRLHKIADKIRDNYKGEWRSKEMRIRQRSVALYFIDKLALRAGNEKDEDQADTVGCCSLRVEHITLHEKKGGKEFVVVFDFLGKDSIRYYNEVQVEKRVFKNLQLFMDNKQGGDDLFDRLNTQILNKHLNELMEGLTAKVFRTYNASRTLQEQLDKMTDYDDPIPAKVLSYNRANREVAILCNHQRSVPKTYEKSMANLQTKIDEKKKLIDDCSIDLKDYKRAAKSGGSVKEKTTYEKKKKALERLKENLHKLEISATDKEENKQIALGTSKLNYLDPRISVAWCKKYDVPMEKVYNKTQRQKFQWAIDMATSDYNFLEEPNAATKFSRNSDGEDEEEEDD